MVDSSFTSVMTVYRSSVRMSTRRAHELCQGSVMHMNEGTDRWWFSAVDVVADLSGSCDARNYWHVLKESGNERLTEYKGFKLIAPDGKCRLTDCFDGAG